MYLRWIVGKCHIQGLPANLGQQAYYQRNGQKCLGLCAFDLFSTELHSVGSVFKYGVWSNKLSCTVLFYFLALWPCTYMRFGGKVYNITLLKVKGYYFTALPCLVASCMGNAVLCTFFDENEAYYAVGMQCHLPSFADVICRHFYFIRSASFVATYK